MLYLPPKHVIAKQLFIPQFYVFKLWLQDYIFIFVFVHIMSVPKNIGVETGHFTP